MKHTTHTYAHSFPDNCHDCTTAHTTRQEKTPTSHRCQRRQPSAHVHNHTHGDVLLVACCLRNHVGPHVSSTASTCCVLACLLLPAASRPLIYVSWLLHSTTPRSAGLGVWVAPPPPRLPGWPKQDRVIVSGSVADRKRQEGVSGGVRGGVSLDDMSGHRVHMYST